MTSDRATGWLLVAAQFLLLAALGGLGVAAIAWGGFQLGRAASVQLFMSLT